LTYKLDQVRAKVKHRVKCLHERSLLAFVWQLLSKHTHTHIRQDALPGPQSGQ